MANKEYAIFITCKGGCPYSLNNYNSFNDALNALNNMILLEQERNRPYYVFNDFYDNEYPASVSGKIFCIKERTVSNWEKYSHNNTFKNNIYNNVYQFPNLF